MQMLPRGIRREELTKSVLMVGGVLLVAFVCLAIGLIKYDNYWIIAGIVFGLVALVLAFIAFQAHEVEVEQFREHEVSWQRKFDDWSDVHQFEVARRKQAAAIYTDAFGNQREDKLSWAEKPNYISDKGVWKDQYDVIKVQEESLQEMADSFLHLFGDMPRVKVLLIRDDGSNASAFGGGGFVYIKEPYYRNAHHASLVQTMKHEMVHNWIYWTRAEVSDPHGPEFKQKLEEVSAEGEPVGRGQVSKA